MNKKTHLARCDRDMIKSMLDEKCNFTQIAAAIGKDRTTVSREVRNHALTIRTNVKYATYNACKHRFSCDKKHVCSVCERNLGRSRRVKFCKKCSFCNFRCDDFVPDPCRKLNMETTLGARIALLRKQNGWKQDELAEKMGVSPQAVSKWENDQACPDITLLPKLAKLLNISVDELLSGKEEKEEETTMVLPEEQRKDISKMLFRIVVDSADGDRVRVNLPLGIIKLVVDSGTQLEIMKNEKLADIDFKSLLEMVEQGVVGELVSVDTTAGDKVRIYVE